MLFRCEWRWTRHRHRHRHGPWVCGYQVNILWCIPIFLIGAHNHLNFLHFRSSLIETEQCRQHVQILAVEIRCRHMLSPPVFHHWDGWADKTTQNTDGIGMMKTIVNPKSSFDGFQPLQGEVLPTVELLPDMLVSALATSSPKQDLWLRIVLASWMAGLSRLTLAAIVDLCLRFLSFWDLVKAIAIHVGREWCRDRLTWRTKSDKIVLPMWQRDPRLSAAHWVSSFDLIFCYLIANHSW